MFRDFKELLSELNAHSVKYLIVGGYAVSLHAEPRATKDLDVLIGRSEENSKAVFAALGKFGAPLEGLTPKDFAEAGSFFRRVHLRSWSTFCQASEELISIRHGSVGSNSLSTPT